MAIFAVICMIVWIKYLNDSFSFIFKTGWPFFFFCKLWKEKTHKVFLEEDQSMIWIVGASLLLNII